MKSIFVKNYYQLISLLIFICFNQKIHSILPCTEEYNGYKCKSGKCIPIEWLCDLRDDCPDGDDERHFKCGSREDRGDCESFHFQCIDPNSGLNKCVRYEWKCDGFIDCEGGVDEVNCEIKPTPLQALFGQPTPPPSRPNMTENDTSFEISSENITNFQLLDTVKNHTVLMPIKNDKNLSSNLLTNSSSSTVILSKNKLKNDFQAVVNNMFKNKQQNSTTSTMMKSSNSISSVKPSTMKNISVTFNKTTNQKISTTTLIQKTTTIKKEKNQKTTQTTPLIPLITVKEMKSKEDSNKKNRRITTIKPFIKPKSQIDIFEMNDDFPALITAEMNDQLFKSTTIKPFIKPKHESEISTIEINQNNKELKSIPSTNTSSSSTTTSTTTVKSTTKKVHKIEPIRVNTIFNQNNDVINTLKPQTSREKMYPVQKSAEVRDTVKQMSMQSYPPPKVQQQQIPIVPVNNFQVLIPLDALKSKNKNLNQKTTDKPKSSTD